MRRLLVLVAACWTLGAGDAQARIEVHAHRGGPYVDGVPTFPENTIPAFRRAAEDGFVLELDVKLTRDRIPLVIHDHTFDRTTTCTGPISAMTAAEVSERCRADVLGVPGNEAALPTVAVEQPSVPVPTLAQVLELARERRARVNVEIKNQPTDNDFDPAPRPGYATDVLDVLDASGVPRSRVIVQSFWPPNLDEAERRGYETSALTLRAMNQAGVEAARARGYEWSSPGWPVDQASVSRAHAHGLRVVPYTLDREDDLRAAAAAAVDEVISNDPARAARVLESVASPSPPVPPAPNPAACRRARADRTLPPIEAFLPRPRAPRVFAIQFKQDPRDVVSYEAFRTKIECTLHRFVVPHLARNRPNVVAFTEDVGLLTIGTGSRGRPAREIFTDPARSPSCFSAGAPCAAVAALATLKAAYARETAAYQARFPSLHPLSGVFVAATDTFVRGWMQTFSDMARRYGVYILGSNNQPPFRESTDPAEIATFADPDLPRPESVFVATSPDVHNEVFMWGPQDVRRAGPRPLRNVVARNKKVPVTPIEASLDIRPGPASGPDGVENVEPYRLPGTAARISFATSLPAFVYGPPPGDADPCSDIAKWYMRCLEELGANLVIQDEANPGPWATYTAADSPDNGAWQPLSWMTSTWRAVADPGVSFDYNVTPHLVGNLADLPFDGQTAVTQRGLGGPRSPTCTYVGNREFVEGTDPEEFFIGGETLAVRPFAGPKPEFVALVPWVAEDASRTELQATARALSPDGNGPLENDYLETAIVADLPFPPEPRRPSCLGARAADHTRARLHVRVSPRRVAAGRRARLRVRVLARGRAVPGAPVRVAGRRARTDRRGRWAIAVRFARPGRRVVRAAHPAFATGRTVVRVVRR